MEQLGCRVGGQIEPVEAGVRSGQGLDAPPALDTEPTGARGAAQRREPLVRDGRSSRHELNKPEPLLVGKPATSQSQF